MKKLALLLGSLLVVTATQAKEVVVAPVEAEKEVVVVAEPVVEEVAVVEEATAPTLKLTGLKTGLWHENRSGHRSGNLGENSLRLYLDFAYGEDWTFSTAIRRYFTSNTKDSYGHEGLFNQGNDKVYLGATRWFEKSDLTYQYITTSGTDTHAFTLNVYPTDYLYVYMDYEYNSRAAGSIADNGDSDSHYFEFEPKLTWNGWTVSYYLEGEDNIENDGGYLMQHVRLYTPAWTYGNFSVSGEWRGYISKETDKYENGEKYYGVDKTMKDAFDVNRIYAHTTYKLNESATLFADLGYEFGKWENDKDGNTKDSDMVIIETGVKYTF